MHVCIVYDCLFPWTHGGVERWHRQLALAIVAAGHDVTYVTRKQWGDDAPAGIPGVRIVAVSDGGPLYGAEGQRRVSPTVRFGAGVFVHLMRHRRRYDVIHTCSFPYFSLLGIRLGLVGSKVPIGVDWFEVWSKEYWRSYLGRAGGTVGWLVQRLCLRLSRLSLVYSQLAERGVSASSPGAILRLPGLLGNGRGSVSPALDPPSEPHVVYVGRHIPEKHVTAIPAAVARAREVLPSLRATILGEGPDQGTVRDEIRRYGLASVISLPGFVDQQAMDSILRTATCLVQPSMREGYGLVVVEAAAWGTPVIVVAWPDNAAVELISPGVNGFVARSTAPAELAQAMVAAHAGGRALRVSTAAWHDDAIAAMSANRSAQVLIQAYQDRIGPRA